MIGNKQRGAFTLIEVLIVVVIMAVLAGAIIPQLTSSAEDARISSLKFNLRTLRSQIDLYKLDHLGDVPAIQSGALPQLTSSTDRDGAIGTGANFPHGPYVQSLPPNPYDNKNTVTATAVFPPTAATAAGGWLYHEATGKIAPNHADHLID